MSGEVPLPTIDGIQSLDFDIERNVATSASPFSRAVQRQVRGGDRWVGSLSFPPNQGDEAGVLNAFLRQATRGDRWFWLSPPHNGVRGAWNPADLISNGGFKNNATGWTASGSTLTVNARRMRVTNTGATRGAGLQDITMEASKPHVLIADSYQGKVTAGEIEVRRVSDSVVEAEDAAFTAPKRTVLLITPTVAAMRVMLFTQTSVAADSLLYGGVSVTRCLQVAGAAQIGNRLNVDGGPTSMIAALKAGEFVCVLCGTLYRLLQLVEDFDTDSSGAGTLVFEPGIDTAPADNAAVIVRNPFARFMIPDHAAPDRVSSPNFHGFTISVAEDVTP